MNEVEKENAPDSSEPKATANDVRLVGLIFFIIAGALGVWFGRGWEFGGILPAPGVGIVLIVVGVVMVVTPEPFRKRVSRFHEIGEELSRKTPGK